MSAAQPRPVSGAHASVLQAHPHHTLLALEVKGGFLDGAKFEFADGLNCVIGGRGTGKTTVLEFLRYTLGLMPDPKMHPARAKALGGLVQSNLDRGRVEVLVRTKHGASYRAVRPANDTAQVFDERGDATAISLDRDHLFRADVYSQNEIEEIATNPAYQLNVIDRFIQDDIQGIDQELSALKMELSTNASTLVRLHAEMRGFSDRATEAAGLAEALKALQQTNGPDAALLNTAHARRPLRDKEKKTLEVLRSDLRRTRKDFEVLVSDSVQRLESRVDPADVAIGPNATVFSAVATEVRNTVGLLHKAARRVQEQTDAVEKVLVQQSQALTIVHAQQEAEYRSLIARSNEASERAAERVKLQQRRAAADEAQKELALHVKRCEGLSAQRRELVGRLSSLRDRRFACRRSVAERLSSSLNPTIRISVAQMANRDAYEIRLNESLRGSGLKYGSVVEKLIQVPPPEFATLVQRGDPGRLAERTSLDLERAQKVIEVFRNTPALYEIETLELEDLPRVELLDGADYKDSTRLSTGQRCTTILPILLLESERPLLVDQPEDNLDNAFIYETVVKSIQGAKGKRQLIFVTHNPNIPVLGDAERVFVLSSDGQRGRVKSVGTVDQVKEEIELHLEGGRDAFELRYKRYGH